MKNVVTGAGSHDFQLRFRAFSTLFDDAGRSGEEAGERSYVGVSSPIEEVVEKKGFDGTTVKKKWVSGVKEREDEGRREKGEKFVKIILSKQ